MSSIHDAKLLHCSILQQCLLFFWRLRQTEKKWFSGYRQRVNADNLKKKKHSSIITNPDSIKFQGTSKTTQESCEKNKKEIYNLFTANSI